MQSQPDVGTLASELPVAVYTTDASGWLTFFNEAAVTLWGRRPTLGEDRWCGAWRMYWQDGTPLPHDRCPMAVAIKENRAVRNVAAIAERPDGSHVRFIPLATPLRDPAGGLVGAVNVLLDASMFQPQGPAQGAESQSGSRASEDARNLLSARERQVMVGIVDGQSTKQVARSLGISPRTVEVHRRKLMSRLQVRNVAALVKVAMGYPTVSACASFL